MMAQLAALTVVSCVCWSPFLVNILMMQINQSPRPSDNDQDGFTLLGLRMASLNQILDPWVYILLRRAVLFRVCCFYTQRPLETANSSYADGRRQTFSLK
ncbi:unnamed protein product [Pleuronectes platessa]|uniref:G-protein coupled receptors family 1 profile domain-containing protein n=1 Tax=Pleuronectes platessa TaxID=8262 RepID=A0A9N7VC88_PLEPL|nr:unnamed protein product [Pleuronectes platessa]